jgi:hypothetical protein
MRRGKAIRWHVDNLLEASEGDVEFKDGRFTITGTDSAMGIHEVAKAAFQLDKLPTGMEPGLYETATYRARSSNFPNGCHICEVEIDPEKGSTRVIGYWVVDDVGRARAAIGGASAHPRRAPARRRQCRQAAGAAAPATDNRHPHQDGAPLIAPNQ